MEEFAEVASHFFEQETASCANLFPGLNNKIFFFWMANYVNMFLFVYFRPSFLIKIKILCFDCSHEQLLQPKLSTKKIIFYSVFLWFFYSFQFCSSQFCYKDAKSNRRIVIDKYHVEISCSGIKICKNFVTLMLLCEY